MAKKGEAIPKITKASSRKVSGNNTSATGNTTYVTKRSFNEQVMRGIPVVLNYKRGA